MALRIHPMSASRWAELSATRLPIDLTAEPSEQHRQVQAEIAQIQAYVDALDPRRAAASR